MLIISVNDYNTKYIIFLSFCHERSTVNLLVLRLID